MAHDAETESLLQGASTVVRGERDCQRQVHVHARKDRRKVGGLPVVWITMEKDDYEAVKSRLHK